jgi:hypothetical protein
MITKLNILKDARTRYAILKGRSDTTKERCRDRVPSPGAHALPQNGREDAILALSIERSEDLQPIESGSKLNSQCIN